MSTRMQRRWPFVLLLLATACGMEQEGGGQAQPVPEEEVVVERFQQGLGTAGTCVDWLATSDPIIEVSHFASTAGATDDAAGSCGGAGAPDKAYEWTAPAYGTYLFQVVARFDTVLYVRSATCGGAELGCNDDALAANSRLVLQLAAGQKVVIFVDGAKGQRGSYSLRVNRVEPADLFEQRRPLATLKAVQVPEPPNLGDFVKDRTAAIALGKALFWDMQVGSDGVQACATCHFSAGADSRSKNQLNPMAGGTFHTAGPNDALVPDDFPLHKLANPDDRLSAVLFDSDDVVSSQGVFQTRFLEVVKGSDRERGVLEPDPIYQVGGLTVRRVEPRNTPTALNAVFNFRNFWDGRAQNDFNGVNPFGARDAGAKVVQVTGGEPSWTRVELKNSALASQSVGPPLSGFEMSYGGRSWPDVGRKLLALRPLQKQQVDATDSVLGGYRDKSGRGLATPYHVLISRAFQPRWWDTTRIVRVQGGVATFAPKPNRALYPNEYTVMEYNFSLFFGLAVQMYESTLVSDDSPLDRFLEGDSTALSLFQKKGLKTFLTSGRCINCHGGPELTNASVGNVTNQRLETMVMGNGNTAVYDNGFYNIGVRPSTDDPGVGGLDPFGNPLSESRLSGAARVAAQGSFKTPGLRNVELTAPYFHNGGQLTLRQVVDFYNRGSDFNEQNRADLDADITRLNLGVEEREALVAFLRSLTDERVRYRKAPFDHPELFIPDGHPGDSSKVTSDGTGKATDSLRRIPAVGRLGGQPLPGFLQAPATTLQAVPLSLH